MAFRYYNTNLDGAHEPDCVTRAMNLALGIPYSEISKRLKDNGAYYQCNFLNKECYEKILDIDFNLPHFVSRNKTVQDIADGFPYDVVIARIDGHLTTCVRGEIWDIWDCSNELVTDFWIVR